MQGIMGGCEDQVEGVSGVGVEVAAKTALRKLRKKAK